MVETTATASSTREPPNFKATCHPPRNESWISQPHTNCVGAAVLPKPWRRSLCVVATTSHKQQEHVVPPCQGNTRALGPGERAQGLFLFQQQPWHLPGRPSPLQRPQRPSPPPSSVPSLPFPSLWCMAAFLQKFYGVARCWGRLEGGSLREGGGQFKFSGPLAVTSHELRGPCERRGINDALVQYSTIECVHVELPGWCWRDG